MAATVFDLALNYLSYCPRTESEIRTYLKKKDYSDKTISETVEKLKYYNYINDKAYFKRAIEDNALGNRYGKRRLVQKLKNKGIKEELLNTIGEYISEEDEKKYCRDHFKKTLKQTEGLPYNKRLNRITSYLSRRGFSYNTFSPMLEKIEKDGEVSDDKFYEHLKHYCRHYKNKGFSGYDFNQRVMRAMLQRGYDYEKVKSELKCMKE